MTFAIVIPTIGRPSLDVLLQALAADDGPRPVRIVVVDDRSAADPPLLPADRAPGWVHDVIEVRASGGRGPAAARNVGWRAVAADWIVFLDDDVRIGPSWLSDLAHDLADASPAVAASQGRISVPLPRQRRPTDWERGTAGLATARWITADIAYRRSALAELRGFDERFRRAFREDADLALRAMAAGHHLEQGRRSTEHPVRPARWSVSARVQQGNADDALMTALHGPDWYERAGAAVGRRPLHLITTAAGVLTVAGLALRRRRAAAAAASLWAALTADFATRRIRPGPRTPREIAAMAATSAAIPPLATVHWLRGRIRHRDSLPWRALAPAPVAAVLLDRDGTLVHDVPYNGDPEKVEPMPGVEVALRRLRAAGLKTGVVTNQSGVARGLLTGEQVAAVNARVDELLGPFDTWQVCPHGDGDGCVCRKPQPGMVHAAAAALAVPVEQCVVVGDTGMDVRAGQAAGAAAVLVPTAVTRPEEVAAAPLVCPTLIDGVDLILGARPR